MCRLPFSLLIAALAPLCATAASPLPVIPLPASADVAADPTPITAPAVTLAFEGVPAELEARLRQELKRAWPGTPQAAGSWRITSGLISRDALALPAEGYRLTTTPAGALLQAADADGLRHAWTTLRAIATPGAGGRLTFPAVTVADAPRFRYRGVLLDSARHIQSVEGIKRLLDQMAALKLNVFHWHLTDNNGWRAEVPSYPKLARVGGFLSRSPESERNGYYTVAQMREIGRYARARGIEVLPEIDVPGHSSALVEAYPEYACPTSKRALPSTWASNRTPHHVVCVGNEALYPFLTQVIKEVADATGATRVHIGGDEVEEGIWKQCPHCAAAMKQAGLKHEYELERVFLDRLATLLRKEGLRSINWLERPASGIPKVDATVAWRGGSSGAGHVETAVAKGIPVIVARGDYAYFDYAPYGGHPKSGWIPTLGLDEVYDYRVIPQAVAATTPELVLGGECTLWTEEVLERDLDTMLFPRLHAFAEQMWTRDGRRDKADFMARLAVVRPREEARGMRFATPPRREAIPSTLAGAKVSCSLPHAGAKYPEYALDGNDVTAFLSEAPAKTGDTFTVTSPTPMRARQVTVITGAYYLHDEPAGRVKSAALEYSPDGAAWVRLRDFKDGFAAAAIPAGTRGLRLRLTGDQGARLVVAEFRVE